MTPYEEDPFAQEYAPLFNDSDLYKLRTITSEMEKRRQQAAAMKRAVAQEKQASAPMMQDAYRQLAAQPRAYGRAGVPDIDRSIVNDAMVAQARDEYLTLNPGMRRFLGQGGAAPETMPERPSLEERQADLLSGDYAPGRRSYTAPAGAKYNISGIEVSQDPKTLGIALRGVMSDEERAAGRESYADAVRRMSVKAKSDKEAQRGRIAAFQAAKRKEQQDLLATPEGRAMAVAMQFDGTPDQKRQIFQSVYEGAARQKIADGNNAQYLQAQSERDRWQAALKHEQRTGTIEALRMRIATEKDPVRRQKMQDQLDQLEFGNSEVTLPPMTPAPAPQPWFNPTYSSPDPTRPQDWAGFRPF